MTTSDPPVPASPGGAPAAGSAGAQQCIALVDDDRNILTAVSIFLQSEGFATRVYARGLFGRFFSTIATRMSPKVTSRDT